MGLTEHLVEFITKLIEKGGYFSVAFFMTLESMFFPVPSEGVMPFAGFLVADGKFIFYLVIIFSTLGSIIGSMLSYVIGYYGGKPFVKKFGKYVLLNQEHLEKSESFFNKFGEATIFIARFVPVIRHFISIPAGFSRMNIFKFIIFTVLGAGLWNTFLCYMGMILKSKWKMIMNYSHYIDAVIVIGILAVLAFFIYKQVKRMQAKAKG
jgi:membrane protein DedA with SNARE-associated domain